MSVGYDFFEAALEDVEEIIEYLDAERVGYGKKFYDCLFQGTKLICEQPSAFPVTAEREDLRKMPIPRPFHQSYTLYLSF